MNIPFSYPISDFPFRHAFGKISNTVYYDEITTAADSQAVATTSYETKITTGGTAGTENISIADGTIVGERKLITLAVRTDASDVVALAHANVVNASGTAATGVTLDAAGEFILLEWNGSKWQAVYTPATIATEIGGMKGTCRT